MDSEANYTKAELLEAVEALTSTAKKIEKVRQKDTLGPSQRTLIERRLRALRISIELIEAKIREEGSSFER